MIARQMERAIRDLAEAAVDFTTIEVNVCEDGRSLMLHGRDRRGQWQAAGFDPGPRSVAEQVAAMFAGTPPE